MFDIREHPDAPEFDELGEYTIEPVAPEEIRRRRDDGDELREVNLLEHDDVDAYVELEPNPEQPGMQTDIGTAYYRFTQLWGTPQFEEYVAGNDVSWRDDETFKYLFEVTEEDGTGEWLITVHDWRVRLGVSLAGWSSELDGDAPAVDPDEAVALLALVTNVASEPVLCEHEEVPF